MPSLFPLAFMSFGFTELLVVGTVAILVFGGQLPDVMRNLGKAYGKFRDGLNEVSQPVRDEIRGVQTYDLPNPRDEIESAVDEIDGGGPWPGAEVEDEETDDPPPSIDAEATGESSPAPTPSDEAAPSDEATKPAGPSKPPSFDAGDDDLLTP